MSGSVSFLVRQVQQQQQQQHRPSGIARLHFCIFVCSALVMGMKILFDTVHLCRVCMASMQVCEEPAAGHGVCKVHGHIHFATAAVKLSIAGGKHCKTTLPRSTVLQWASVVCQRTLVDVRRLSETLRSNSLTPASEALPANKKTTRCNHQSCGPPGVVAGIACSTAKAGLPGCGSYESTGSSGAEAGSCGVEIASAGAGVVGTGADARHACAGGASDGSPMAAVAAGGGVSAGAGAGAGAGAVVVSWCAGDGAIGCGGTSAGAAMGACVCVGADAGAAGIGGGSGSGAGDGIASSTSADARGIDKPTPLRCAVSLLASQLEAVHVACAQCVGRECDRAELTDLSTKVSNVLAAALRFSEAVGTLVLRGLERPLPNAEWVRRLRALA